jgi:hypothetical protein
VHYPDGSQLLNDDQRKEITMHLDHITVRTRDLPGTKDFFLKVFDDLEERERPKATPPEQCSRDA